MKGPPPLHTLPPFALERPFCYFPFVSMHRFIMALCFFSFFLCTLSMWTGSLFDVQKASGDVSFLLFAQMGSNHTTPQPSVCRFSFSLLNVFHLQKPPPSKYLSRPQRRLPRFVSAFPFIPTLIQKSARRRCRLSRRLFHPFLLASYASVVQVLHAPFRVFSVNDPLALLLYHQPHFRILILCFITWAIALLVIDAYYVSLPPTLL